MTNFQVLFSSPWLLLLLIPALLFTVLPYFRIKKRYRCTRNRVCSMVLHGLIMVFIIMLIAGLTFAYTVPNTQNALIILVDVSYSNEDAQEQEDSFIQSVVANCGADCQLGIVKFAYDQVYAGELSYDADKVYEQYLNSDDPDTSATDLASALKYCASLFDSPETSKIVIVSDGIETDGDAANAIKTVAAQGIKVDTAYFGNAEENEVQIVDVTLPDYNVSLGVAETISVTVQGNINYDGKIKVYLYDDSEGVEEVVYEAELADGDQILEFEYTFNLPGLHILHFEIKHDKDTLTQNNTFYSYLYIEQFDNVLLLESNVGEAEDVITTLEDGDYNVTVFTVSDKATAFRQSGTVTETQEFPSTLNELSKYDQVILDNVAYSDFPDGFEDILYEYVYTVGGGLLTVGGEDDTNEYGDVISHAYYNKDLLASTYYRSMLPIQVVDDYTPPVSVMIVVDCSGSMTTSKIEQAITGALACLDSLNTSDYVGIIEYASSAKVTLSMTSVANKSVIETAMRKIGNDKTIGSSTQFSQALYLAGMELGRTDTAFKHIILITDGMPGDNGAYQTYIEDNYKTYGITMSIVGIQLSTSAYSLMLSDVTICGCDGQVLNATEVSQISFFILESFQTNVTDKINSVIEQFTPTIEDYSSSVVAGIDQANMPILKGYYGSVLKSGASAILTGPWDVPIYAQWSYGAGTVGSFLSSFNSDSEGWSSDFATNSYGQRFLLNVVNALMPKNSIEQSDITATFVEDNYSNQLNVYTDLEEDGWIDVTITALSSAAAQYYNSSNPIEVTPAANYTRFTFTITCGGLYKIVIDRKDANGAITESLTLYKTFSYSEEYDEFPDTDGKAFMESLAESGNGIVASNAQSIYDSFDKYLNKVFDPRIVLLILIIILLLLDVAVRKFKFKWPHELIREHKEKKLQEQQEKNSI